MRNRTIRDFPLALNPTLGDVLLASSGPNKITSAMPLSTMSNYMATVLVNVPGMLKLPAPIVINNQLGAPVDATNVVKWGVVKDEANNSYFIPLYQ